MKNRASISITKVRFQPASSVPQVRARPLGANLGSARCLGSARLAAQPPGFITNAV